MAKKILDYTIIMPEQMPKVEGVEQQWRVVERAMCSCKAGNPPGRNLIIGRAWRNSKPS